MTGNVWDFPDAFRADEFLWIRPSTVVDSDQDIWRGHLNAEKPGPRTEAQSGHFGVVLPPTA